VNLKDTLNNRPLPNVAHDKQAKIGCKGGNKFWYGYKKHVSVDMQSGLINKVAITPANLGICKNQFSELMFAICFNLKRMVVLAT
jgi:hypothetical protein